LPSLAQLCTASAQPNGILTDLPSIIIVTDRLRSSGSITEAPRTLPRTPIAAAVYFAPTTAEENKTYSEQIYRVHSTVSKTAKGMHLSANDESNTKKQQLKNSHMVRRI
jgi:hypothetical protein